MLNMFFYPTLNNRLKEEAACKCGEYLFSYRFEGNIKRLDKKVKKQSISLSDSDEQWRLDRDGMLIKRTIEIQYPMVLKGKNGIVCDGAEIGVCILWIATALKEMGYIFPRQIGDTYYFEYEFKPGEIKGNILFETILYVKSEAEEVKEEEQNLINEQGVTLGVLDAVTVDFGEERPDFPIREVHEAGKPIWWAQLEGWDDPLKDPFDEDHVCVILNTYHTNACPKNGEKIKNKEMLIEILSAVYMMLFVKLKEMDCLDECLSGQGEPGSIAEAVYHFYSDQVGVFKREPVEALQKSIHEIVVANLREGDDA